ncbi:hypothetical protein T484DRAFT_1953948 [Baffinella frigidus]|nr:hypothetical protein T484DRAFT_1953948 [Cryptophyta sp. CCMP2293]|mmetsp:Transcript_47603/g.113342  ORF Transcript_47603/g.113342 Transcript_47603/m.113342 type:complete len:221 (-) Transcript_47603:165-827(-)
MTAAASKNILRASVAILLLPLALGFAPATSTMHHLSSSGNRRAGYVPSRALPRVATGPLAATMLDSRADDKVTGQRRREEAAGRQKTVLMTAVATLSAVFMLASATPASAFDGGSLVLMSEDVPAVVLVGLSKEAKVDARVAVPQEYRTKTPTAPMAMEVTAKDPTYFGQTAGERLRDFVLKAIFLSASLVMVPFFMVFSFRRERASFQPEAPIGANLLP